MRTARTRFKRRRQIACPRCGYDFLGTVSSWCDTCPLDGQCNECGLAFAWRDICVQSEHPWLFEYHWRRRPLRRLFLTFVTALRPFRFWKRVRLTDPVHLRPLSIVMLTAVAIALVAAVVQRVVDVARWRRPGTFEDWAILTWQVGAIELPQRLLLGASGLVLAVVGMPLAFMLLPTTLRRARVRRRHVARIWMYSLIGPAILATTWLLALAVVIRLDGNRRWIDPWRWISSRASFNDPFLTFVQRWLPEVAIMTFAIVWMIVWWWGACRAYLKIRHALASALLLGVMLWLAGAAIEIVG